MPPPPQQKPENVLKRANELIGVNQAPAALALLHEHITSKRSRNAPIASLEPVMLLLVKLSVEQKKGKLAKDALYQYKNIAQNSNVATIELVLADFLQQAAEKVDASQKKADEVQSSLEATQAAATSSIDDLEASETPESILLATVSGEQSRDRTDRAIVTPWLKFLWEAYRTVLDILRNNARLELMYQNTAIQAFDFCQKYARKTEFRRLCELLRNHVQTAAKYSTQMHAINLSDPDTLQRHLETRFQQLNVAVELELWQEAFRSVEDIHTLLSLSKRPAKNVMMANYFEKLTRIFLVGENYLFHAAAWARYYGLLRQSHMLVASGQGKKSDNPPASEADLERAASFVLLSALSIPVISTSRSRGAMVDFDEAKKNKNSRLTHLLSLGQAPTRASLFRDALSKALHRRARPEIRDLYNILEVDFHPLSICKKISPILTKIGEDPEMQKYIQPLQQVILTRLFQQLSQVYETVDLSFVESLAEFPEDYKVSRATIEKFIMNGNKKGDLSIRMNHATGVLSFDTDVFSSSKAVHTGSAAGSAEAEARSVQRLQSTPSEIVRSQLSRLAKALYTTCYYVDASFNQARIDARNEAMARAHAGAEQEHLDILSRKDIIQKRKEEASEQQAKRERENATLKRMREHALQEAERQRQQQEQEEREQRRRARELDQIRQTEVENMIKEMNLGSKVLDVGTDDLSSLDPQKLRAMKLAQLEREKNDVNERLRVTGKRLDHLERAYRKEEIKKLAADYAEQQKQDHANYDAAKAETLKEAKRTHEANVELKHRLTRLVVPFKEFRDDIISRRRDEFDRRRREAERELEKQITQRKKEFRERKLREKREKEDEERQLREAEERAAREKEEQKVREEARREELLRHKAQRDEERQEALEKAALQARREEEALARRKAEREKASAAPFRREPVADAPTSERRPLNLPGARSWRDREASKNAEGGAAAPSAAAAAAAPATASPAAASSSAYAPPAARSSTPMERTDSSERPPRLQLAGGKPSWRDRDASRTTGGSSDRAPSKEGLAPRSFSGRGPVRGDGPSRELARDNGRDASPAAAPKEPLMPSGAPGKYVPKFRREAN